jgi:hypothetical protein
MFAKNNDGGEWIGLWPVLVGIEEVSSFVILLF